MTDETGISRRTFLGAGAALIGAGAVAACQSGTDDAGSAGSSVVRVAAGDTTKSTGLDIRTMGFGASYVILYHLYDSLAYLTTDGNQLGLAASVDANADATEWTIKLRDGATFHDGRPVEAVDVAYSLATVASEKSNRASVYAAVDAKGIRTPDTSTVVVPLNTARGDFLDSVLAVFSPVVPRDTTDFAKGVGSGPYKLAGQDQTTLKLVRNDSYWGPKPEIQELRVVRINDAAARLSAVKSGQADYAVSIAAVGAKASQADSGLEIRRGGAANSQALSFAMNQTLAPFDDPRVRQAVRLAADRRALVQQALLDLGTEGNDVAGKGLAGYDAALPQREQDLDQARSLFRAAGVSKLTLQTAELVPGMTNASRLLAQQLAGAGVTLTLQQIPPQAFYADLAGLAKRPFQTFYYVNRPAAVHLSSVTAKTSTFNVTGLGPQWWSKLSAAQAEPDDTRRTAMFTALERTLYDTGGDLLWGFQEQTDAARRGMKGVQIIQSTPVFRTAALS